METKTQKQTTPEKRYTSFRVDNVELSNKKLRTEPILQVFADRVGAKPPKDLVAMSNPRHQSADPYKILGLSYKGKILTQSRYYGQAHPILQAVNDAFNNHLPITFSPDIIWQVILQGVAEHIGLFPEEYRKFLVKHEGVEKIQIVREDLSLNNLEEIGENLDSITDEFVKIINSKSSKIHNQLFSQKFSTTTRIEQISANIISMGAFSPYFGYEVLCLCGFPEVRLMGTPEDWSVIYSKVKEIEELFYINDEVNLTWWTKKLEEVIKHFILSSQGNPSIGWWKKCYKQLDSYASRAFNGWIGWLYPYTKTRERWDGKSWIKPSAEWERNPMLDNIKNEAVIKTHEKPRSVVFNDNNKRNLAIDVFNGEALEGAPFMSTKDFPLGISKVDLKITDISMNESIDTLLIGGFLGVKQDNEDGNVTPLIGYGLLK